MNRKSFFTRFYLGNLLLVGVILVAGMLVAARQTQTWHASRSEGYQSQLLRSNRAFFEANWPMTAAQIEDFCVERMREVDYRLTVISPEGVVLGDNRKEPHELGPHRTPSRPEILAALEENSGRDERVSESTSIRYRYFAEPIVQEHEVVGVVRVAMPVEDIEQQLAFLNSAIFWSFGLMASAALLLGLLMSWIWYRPLRVVTEASRRIAEGDLSEQPRVDSPLELAQLSSALDSMRRTVSSQLGQIRGQREKLRKILECIPDAILAADAQGSVAFMNHAAIELLQVHTLAAERLASPHLNAEEPTDPARASVSEHHLQKVVRQVAIVDLYNEAYAAREPRHAVVDVDLFGRRYVLEVEVDPALSGSHDDASDQIHTIVVLRDITARARTDQMKSDFVANASHELRTPLATIRAAIDTLADETASGEEVGRIVSILDRHVGRLEAMANDLLDLHVVENDSLRAKWEPCSSGEAVDWLRAQFEQRANEKDVELEITSEPADAQFQMDRKRLLLIIQNLTDNALKFTPSGGHVRVMFQYAPDWLTIRVIDTGCGIAADEQPKVFERFYQADAARSGDNRIRGTGLGLAIVKHATEGLGGRVQLSSRIDVGTTVEVTVRAPSIESI